MLTYLMLGCREGDVKDKTLGTNILVWKHPKICALVTECVLTQLYRIEVWHVECSCTDTHTHIYFAFIFYQEKHNEIKNLKQIAAYT